MLFGDSESQSQKKAQDVQICQKQLFSNSESDEFLNLNTEFVAYSA